MSPVQTISGSAGGTSVYREGRVLGLCLQIRGSFANFSSKTNELPRSLFLFGKVSRLRLAGFPPTPARGVDG
jgi:hypothetical protein